MGANDEGRKLYSDPSVAFHTMIQAEVVCYDAHLSHAKQGFVKPCSQAHYALKGSREDGGVDTICTSSMYW